MGKGGENAWPRFFSSQGHGKDDGERKEREGKALEESKEV